MNSRFFNDNLGRCISTARDNKKNITFYTVLATSVLFPAAMAAVFFHYLNNKNQADAMFDESLSKLNSPTFNTSTFPDSVLSGVKLDPVMSCREYAENNMIIDTYGSAYSYASRFCYVYPDKVPTLPQLQYLWNLCYEALNSYCHEYSEEHGTIQSSNIGMALSAISAIIFLAVVIPTLLNHWRKKDIVFENNDHEIINYDDMNEIELTSLYEANESEMIIDIDPDSLDESKLSTPPTRTRGIT